MQVELPKKTDYDDYDYPDPAQFNLIFNRDRREGKRRKYFVDSKQWDKLPFSFGWTLFYCMVWDQQILILQCNTM
jgi:hypothetical protein